MRRIVYHVFLAGIIISCEYNDIARGDESRGLWTPYLTSTLDNGHITLHWAKSMCAEYGHFICPQTNPDFFQILMSTSSASDFSVLTTVDNQTFVAGIDDLTNGEPYYFAIRAIKDGLPATTSMTVMTIPGEPGNVTPLFTTAGVDRQHGTWSPAESSIAYIREYVWNNGNSSVQSLFVANLLDETEMLVEISSRTPQWSPDGKRIVYQTDNGMVNTAPGYRPTHISLFDVRDSTIMRLTGGNSFNFLPAWSPDGKWVAFLSDRGDGTEYNIWKIPADSGAMVQVTTDFNDMNELGIKDDRSPKKPAWSSDGSRIAFARYTKSDMGYNSDIYAVPSNGGNKTMILSSPWGDYCPAYSADGTFIAFVSDRSGSNQIWTMNMQTKKLKQITGSLDKWISAHSGIEWSASGDKILFTASDGGYYSLYSVETE